MPTFFEGFCAVILLWGIVTGGFHLLLLAGFALGEAAARLTDRLAGRSDAGPVADFLAGVAAAVLQALPATACATLVLTACLLK